MGQEHQIQDEGAQRRDRGSGRVFHPEYGPRDERKKSNVYWIQYYRYGKPMRESSGSALKWKAEKLLKQRLGESTTDNFVEPSSRRIRVSTLAEAMLDDYRVNNRASLEITEQRWNKRLLPYFGQMRAVDVTTDQLKKYIIECKQQGLQNATINRDVAALKRAFYLGYRSTPRKVQQMPMFPKRLEESPPRAGFVEDQQYDLLCQYANGDLWLRTLLAVGYTYGFRRGELLSMRVAQVDLLHRVLRLNPGTTKNKRGRTVKLTNETYQLLAACVAGKRNDKYVLTRSDGERVTDLRGAWEALCIKAGLGERKCMACGEPADGTKRCGHCQSKRKPKYVGLLLHDLRRSAVRNMVRRGVPQSVAMQISGHLTDAVFRRYDIVSEADLDDARRRIEQGRVVAPVVLEQSSWKNRISSGKGKKLDASEVARQLNQLAV